MKICSRSARAGRTGVFSCLALAALTASPALGQQCGTYSVAPGTTAFVAGTTDIGLHQDDGTQALTLPFAVSVYGQSFTTVNVSSNGNLQFGSASAAFTNACLPSNTFTGPAIAPYWDDLYTSDAASGQGVFTALSGTPGSQQFVIEWRTQFCCASGAPVNDFEVIFYENQNFFDVVYGTPLTPTTSATVGIQAASIGPATQVVCNAAGPTSGQSLRFSCAVVVPSGSCCTGSQCAVVLQTACPPGSTFTANGTCGGPTAYRIVPNMAPFEDISATGTALTALQCDDCSTNVTLPFTFNYLGTDYTSVSVSSNGYIQFGGSSSVFTNAPIPSTGAPDNFVAPLWDDFDLTTGRGVGQVYVLSEASRVVISWVGVGQYNLGGATTDQNSFQVVLRSDGEIEFRYGSITPENTAPSVGVGDYTIGYENASGNAGSSVPGASLGSGNTALLLTHSSPCSGGPATGACCSGSTCSVVAQASCSGANTRFAGGAACNASGNNTQPCCKADYNQSGTVTVQDIFDFLAGYFTQNPSADINGAGGVTVQDIFDFLAAYFTGC